MSFPTYIINSKISIKRSEYAFLISNKQANIGVSYTKNLSQNYPPVDNNTTT
jgi:hypothetical protein